MTSPPNFDGPRRGRAAASADVFVLSCIDYRLANDVTAYLTQRGLDERYAEARVAGGGLAAVDGTRPNWVSTVWENLALSRQIHGVRRLLVVNHRDCSAVAHRFGRAAVADPDAEFRLHVRICQEVADEAARRDPSLEVEFGFMELDGRVQRIVTQPPRSGARQQTASPSAAPDRRATSAERVRARLAGRPIDRAAQFDLLQLGVTEHGLSAEEADVVLRSAVAESDGRLDRDTDAAVEAFLLARAGRRRRVSEADFEAATRLMRMGNETATDAVSARRRVKTIMQRQGARPRSALWPPFSRRWYNRI